MQIPLLLYGCAARQRPLCEDGRTVEINAHGALIVMNVPVEVGERLLVTNNANNKIQECKVLSVRGVPGGSVAVVIEFIGSAAGFWRKL